MTTLRRIKSLTLMQLTNRKFFQKMNSKLQILVFFLLRLLSAIIITAVCALIIFVFNDLISISINQNVLLFFITFMQVISIISFTVNLPKTLYMSKDNAILLQFPARHSEIFISKIIVCYINEFTKNLKHILPFLIAFGIMGRAPIDIGYWFTIIPLLLVLPIIPILVGSILSIPYMYIRKFLGMVPLLETLVGVGIIVGIGILAIRLVWLIPVPLRLLANYGKFATWLNNLILSIDSYLYGFKNIVACLFPTRTFVDFLVLFGIPIILLILATALAMPLYFRLINSSSENSIRKKHTTHSNKQKGVFFTYFKKECLTLFRSEGKLLSYASTIVSFPFLLYVVNYIFAAINTNSLGHSLIIGFNLVIGISLLTANNAFASTSISSEGGEFAVLKTAPSKTYKIIWAKILLYQIASTIAIILGFTSILAITKLDTYEILILFFSFLFIEFGHLLWSVQFDVLKPRLHEVAQVGTAYTNPNVGFSILAGLLTSILTCVITLLFMLKTGYMGGMIRLLILAFIFFAIRLVLLIVNSHTYFKRIEL